MPPCLGFIAPEDPGRWEYHQSESAAEDEIDAMRATVAWRKASHSPVPSQCSWMSRLIVGGGLGFLLLASACAPHDTGTLVSGEVGEDDARILPSVSAPCPPGATAQQCARMEQEVARLLSHGNMVCVTSAQEFNNRLAEGKVEVRRNGEGTETWWGASGYWAGGFTGTTILYDKAFTDDEVGKTIVHEVFGHQLSNNWGSEELAEYAANLCGGDA